MKQFTVFSNLIISKHALLLSSHYIFHSVCSLQDLPTTLCVITSLGSFLLNS